MILYNIKKRRKREEVNEHDISITFVFGTELDSEHDGRRFDRYLINDVVLRASVFREDST